MADGCEAEYACRKRVENENSNFIFLSVSRIILKGDLLSALKSTPPPPKKNEKVNIYLMFVLVLTDCGNLNKLVQDLL